MKNKTIILQEDDCAPDARTSFLARFQKIFGISFDEWKIKAIKISKYDDEIMYQYEDIIACCSASDPYWAIYKKEG